MSDDVIDEITAVAARAMAEWMKAGGVDIFKPIHTITATQMKVLAQIAWNTCVVEESKRRRKAFVLEPIDTDQLDLWMAG